MTLTDEMRAYVAAGQCPVCSLTMLSSRTPVKGYWVTCGNRHPTVICMYDGTWRVSAMFAQGSGVYGSKTQETVLTYRTWHRYWGLKR